MKPSFDQLNLTFATTYNWGVEFLDSKFALVRDGYTITGVTEEMGNIVEKTWTVGHRVITIPHQVGQTTVTIDFNDTGDLTFFKYLDERYSHFSGEDKDVRGSDQNVVKPKGVRSYDQNVVRLRITKYTQDGEVVSQTLYHVYPFGTLIYSGSSEAQLLTGKATFRVVKREIIN